MNCMINFYTSLLLLLFLLTKNIEVKILSVIYYRQKNMWLIIILQSIKQLGMLAFYNIVYEY